MVNFYTGYSEIALLESNRLRLVLQQLENIWILHHGDPLELWAEQEFNLDVMKKWAMKGGIIFRDLPARRHNKDGMVERKNRVVKDILERFDHDEHFREMPMSDRIHAASFSSKIV